MGFVAPTILWLGLIYKRDPRDFSSLLKGRVLEPQWRSESVSASRRQASVERQGAASAKAAEEPHQLKGASHGRRPAAILGSH
jgi:hypothetical protein